MEAEYEANNNTEQVEHQVIDEEMIFDCDHIHGMLKQQPVLLSLLQDSFEDFALLSNGLREVFCRVSIPIAQFTLILFIRSSHTFVICLSNLHVNLWNEKI